MDWIWVQLATDYVPSQYDYKTSVQAENRVACCFPAWSTAQFEIRVPGQGGGNAVIGVGTNSVKALYWWVWTNAYAAVGCLRGSEAWAGYGCVGDDGDMVAFGQRQQLEWVTYGEGWWIARIYDAAGNPADLARVYITGLSIDYAGVGSRETWSGDYDPRVTMNFLHYHPLVKLWGGPFIDWPASGDPPSTHNFLYSDPAYICPVPYGAEINIGGDARHWRTANYYYGYNRCTADPLF